MQIVQVLPVNQQVQHIVALSTDVQTSLDPVKFGQLEELCCLKSFEQVSFVLRLGVLVMKRIQNPAL